jgi:hypothetical protein
MASRRRFLEGVGAALVFPPIARATPTVDVRGPVLGPLLARNRETHTGATRGANHASMAILALAALGGTSEQLADFGERMIRKQRPFPTGGGLVTAESWRASLGNIEALPAFRRLFTEEIARRGTTGTLRRYLPHLIPGLAAAEFHCMIRTAYGVRFGDSAEVAMGLAYWSAAFLSLGSLPPPGKEVDPIACLTDVRARFQDVTIGNVEGGKAGQLKSASLLPGFPAAASLALDDRSLARISRVMVRLLAVPGRDLLHTVTGTHAYRTLEPFLPDWRLGRRYLWQALVAYYVSAGSPELADPPPPALPSWPEILAAALRSPGDHGLKLTHTAIEEYRLYRDVRYLEVAARQWKLV